MALKKYISILLLTVMLCIGQAQDFSITRIHYDGGGDWYGDPSSLSNLLSFLDTETSMVVDREPHVAKITDPEFLTSPYLYLTGHGNIRFSEKEELLLRSHLLSGAFLHADDNYGMDESFRREMSRVFPEKEWVELPYSHPVFSSYYTFADGLPKVHEHDNKPPQALGLFEGNRLLVLYTYESDLGDGWEDEEVHHDPLAIRRNALKMGVNIVYHALVQPVGK